MPTRNAVCLCTDRKMLIPALFVANAVRTASAGSSIPFDVVIVAEAPEVTEVHRAWMAERGILLDDRIDLSALHGVAKLQERLSVASLTKLLLARHFAGRYDRILYLDADLTIHGDIGGIFALDTGRHVLAAVETGRIWADQKAGAQKIAEDHFSALGMSRPYRFFNSGVVYIDVDKWNQADLGARVLTFIRENRDLCYLPDEHGLNGVLDGSFARLSPVWNMRPITANRAAIREIAQPVIEHYVGEDKPWRRYGYRKRLFPDLRAYRLYQSFLRDTPWPKWLEDQSRLSDIRLNLAWELRRITRALRGRPEGPSRRQRLEYARAFREYCAGETFADVEQGIVVRDGGSLRLESCRAGMP